MRLTILLFARLRDIAGRDRLEREIAEGATAADVWRSLAAEFPELDRYTTAVSTAINEEYARMSAPVHDRDEVAFLPPVSGGVITCSINCSPSNRATTSWSPGWRIRRCRPIRPSTAPSRKA